MALYFGLNINNNLTDIQDSEQALLNLNLDIRDLDRIRGTEAAQVTRSDIRTLSRLDVDLEKEVSSLYRETNTYVVLTTNVYDESSLIKNNVTVNGQIGASSIKYKFVDWDAGNVIKYADISTSRVSSWSSFGDPLQIFYGGEVQAQGNVELSSLAVNDNITSKRFAAEIPTHRIKVRINGEDIWMYAMKGIPLTFVGFFRSCDVYANINTVTDQTGAAIKPTWVIKNTSDGAEYVYKDRLDSTTSRIYFGDTSAKERELQFYYPIDRITYFYLPSIGLIELPTVVLPNLATLLIHYNDFREMPILSKYTGLKYLNVSHNDLTRAANPNAITNIAGTVGNVSNNSTRMIYTATITVSSTTGLVKNMLVTKVSGTGVIGNAYIKSVDSGVQVTIKSTEAITAGAIVFTAQYDLRSFSPAIVERLPTGIENVFMGNCFRDTSTADFTDYTSLLELNLDVNYWYEKHLTGTTPAVYKDYVGAGAGDKIKTYSIHYNSYSTLHASVMDSKSLVYVQISWNGITNTVYFSSDKIEVFVGWGNYYPLVSLANRRYLREYYMGWGGGPGGEITSIFNGCNSLLVIYTIYTNAYGAMPTFTNCDSLYYINFEGTNIREDNNGEVISADTFNSCRAKLQYFIVTSPKFSITSTFNEQSFKNMPALYYVQISSGKNGITGNIPNFSSAKNITYILIYNNFLNGAIPNFDGCNSLFYLHLIGNELTGSVPNVNSPNFQHLLLSYNKLSSFNKIDSVTLRRMHLDYNQITSIPDLSNLTYLQELLLNNQNVTSVKYTAGSLSGLISIRTINLANNGIGEGDINQILRDLLTNYEANPRGGVYVNLTGNAPPGATAEVSTILKNLASVGWTIQTA